MAEQALQPQRDARGRLLPGQTTVAPAGSPRKRRALKAILAKAVSTEDLELILVNGVKDAHKNPTGSWAMLLANKLLPSPKSEMSPISIDLGDVTDSIGVGRKIIEAVSRSEISPDAAQALLQSMAALNSMVEIEQLKLEIESLRELLSDSRK